MIARLLAVFCTLMLCGCAKPEPRKSLVGDFAVPGTFAMARDTITVWQRLRQPDGAWRFHSYSITSGGTVEYLDELERVDAPETSEDAHEVGERRQSFTLPQAEFEAIRTKVAQLRPGAMGPDDPVRGYAGEAYPTGCTQAPGQPRLAGINFLNDAGWGAFVLQPSCTSAQGKAAAAAMAQVFERLARAANQPRRP